jgi:LacI family transcriptional regulator
MTTIRDVAKRARVSVGTVSNVLNGSATVREENRQRVLDAIRELNYHPSAVARSLNTQRTNMIGMIRTELRPGLPNNEPDPFVLDLIDGISSAAVGTGIGVAYWTIPVGQAELELYQQLVLSKQIDGLILFALRENDPRVQLLNELDFPFVVFGCSSSNNVTHWIDVDGAHGIEQCVLHLGSLGHNRIAYLSPPREQYLAKIRWDGFVQGMQKIGASIDKRLVFESDFTESSGEACTNHLLNLPDKPTAIVCNNDRMAFGAMRAIKSAGLEVGKDVSVTGFDDISIARYWHPALTTVEQPIREVGQELFGMLYAVLRGELSEGTNEQLIIPTLKVRESTGRAH